MFNSTQPPQAEIDHAIGLYNQGELKQTVAFAENLAEKYPNATILYDILAAAYMSLKKINKTIECYQKLLKLNPNHTDAYNNMGMALYDQGRFDEAVESYRKVVKLEPDFADAHYNLGNALMRTGDLKQAIVSYKASLAINPNDAEVLFNYGNALKSNGAFDQAIEAYANTLKVNSSCVDAQTKMDNAIEEKTEIDKLIAGYSRIAKIKIGSAEVASFTGTMLNSKGYTDAAIESYKQAIKINPEYAEAYLHMGNVLKANGKLDAAIESYKQAIKINPEYAEAYNNMGNALNGNRELELAANSYKQAIKFNPEYAEAHYNMGVFLKGKGDLDAAIESYKQAIKIKPDYAQAYLNMGVTLNDKGELEAAIDSYKQAIKIKPDYAQAYLNQSLIFLSKGDFSNGWPLYQWRWDIPNTTAKPLSTSKPMWRPGKRQKVLLWAEQGIGDEVMYASLILDLYSLCSKLIVQIDIRLISLFRRSFPADIDFYSKTDFISETKYDAHIPMGSASLHLRQNLDSFKSISKGWLSACTIKTSYLRKKLLADGSKSVIGISWYSTKPRSGAQNKTIPLTKLAAVLNLPKVKLVSLQYGDVNNEIKSLREEFGIDITQLSEIDNKNDLDGLAALIMACDKVVSISNLTIHLAGALGKDAKLLLTSSCDWRWGRNRNTCYWYASVGLHRQTEIGNWDQVLQKL